MKLHSKNLYLLYLNKGLWVGNRDEQLFSSQPISLNELNQLFQLPRNSIMFTQREVCEVVSRYNLIVFKYFRPEERVKDLQPFFSRVHTRQIVLSVELVEYF